MLDFFFPFSEKEPARKFSHHLRMGQTLHRATIFLLAKPEILLSIYFTAAFCTVPLCVASFTYRAFCKSFVFFIFFLSVIFLPEKKCILSHNVASLALLKHFSIVLCQGLLKYWHTKCFSWHMLQNFW